MPPFPNPRPAPLSNPTTIFSLNDDDLSLLSFTLLLHEERRPAPSSAPGSIEYLPVPSRFPPTTLGGVPALPGERVRAPIVLSRYRRLQQSTGGAVTQAEMDATGDNAGPEIVDAEAVIRSGGSTRSIQTDNDMPEAVVARPWYDNLPGAVVARPERSGGTGSGFLGGYYANGPPRQVPGWPPFAPPMLLSRIPGITTGAMGLARETRRVGAAQNSLVYEGMRAHEIKKLGQHDRKTKGENLQNAAKLNRRKNSLDFKTNPAWSTMLRDGTINALLRGEEPPTVVPMENDQSHVERIQVTIRRPH